MPSVTGIVVTLTLSRSGDLLSSSDVDALESQIASDYGVNPDDVTVDATFTVSGSVDVDNIPADVTDSQLEEILEENIADTLGIHSSDVYVVVDPSSGDVTYTVSSDTDVGASALQDTLESSSFASDLTVEILDDLPTASVGSVTADPNIDMALVVTIDATESTVDIEEANTHVVSNFDDDGFSTDSETAYVTSKPQSSRSVLLQLAFPQRLLRKLDCWRHLK
eukprot:TRINITY_DN4034_c0_g1_i1.p1 TRINITY_DN4034_c0_g1~~TRINITY_DN4034_c0_g1_i1.p1  ORF type:complete len:223 (+),score=43.83 TRINITY_DN4034_c0_g1_i1:559-1227(+)